MDGLAYIADTSDTAMSIAGYFYKTCSQKQNELTMRILKYNYDAIGYVWNNSCDSYLPPYEAICTPLIDNQHDEHYLRSEGEHIRSIASSLHSKDELRCIKINRTTSFKKEEYIQSNKALTSEGDHR